MLGTNAIIRGRRQKLDTGLERPGDFFQVEEKIMITTTREEPVMPRMTKEQKDWQAESDAHTLAQAEEIAADRRRLAAAKKKATDMAQAAVKTANQYVKVARRAAPKKKAAPKRRAAKKAAPKRRAAKSTPRRR